MSNEDDVFMEYVKEISFLGAIGIIILWMVIILSSFFASFGANHANAMDAKAIDERLKAIEVVAVKEAPKSAAAKAGAEESATTVAAIDGNAIVTATCAACHATGLLNSPKIGDKEAWDNRIQANGDLDGLVKSAIVGKGAMPARGGNAGLSDAEVKAAIEFMMQ